MQITLSSVWLAWRNRKFMKFIYGNSCKNIGFPLKRYSFLDYFVVKYKTSHYEMLPFENFISINFF